MRNHLRLVREADAEQAVQSTPSPWLPTHVIVGYLESQATMKTVVTISPEMAREIARRLEEG